MSERSTDALVHQLARELEPVAPIPRLRSAALLATGLWGVAVLVGWLAGAPLPDLGTAQGGSGVLFAGVLAGLVLAAGGGLVAALAGAVPGRETAARSGGVLLLGGLVLALGVTAFEIVAGGATLRGPAAADVACSVRAIVFGAAPMAVAIVFLLRAFALRPVIGAVTAAVAGACLGAVVVHTSCAIGADALHVGIGHCLAPIAIAAAVVVPLAVWRVRLRSD